MNFLSNGYMLFGVKHAFDVFVEGIERMLLFKDTVYIGVCGGRSLLGFYAFLMQYLLKKKFDRGKVYFFLVDERLVPYQSKESNARMLDEVLLFPLLDAGVLQKEQWIVPSFEWNGEVVSNREQARREYASKIPWVDIALLGVGEDGHIASIFKDDMEWLFTSHEKFVYIDDSPKLPKERITLTGNFLLCASSLFLFFVGKEKEMIARKVLSGVYEPLPVLFLIKKKPCFICMDTLD